MIRYFDVRLNAAHPELPLMEATAIVGSPSTANIYNVPAQIGTWDILKVFIQVAYPDGSTVVEEAVKTAQGIWTATVPMCSISGRVRRGFTIIADGEDENGEEITGYILGVADFAVYTRGLVVTAGETTYTLRYFNTQPTTPRTGDVSTIDGTLKFYNGYDWVSFANIDFSDYYTKAQTDGAIESAVADKIPWTADRFGRKTSATIGTREDGSIVGSSSFANGRRVTASGESSHAEGIGTVAAALYSHAEGQSTTVTGNYSHAEGYNTTVESDSAHAEGCSTTVTSTGRYAHAEGLSSTASGWYAHAEGVGAFASGGSSHADGYYVIAAGDRSHAVGCRAVTAETGEFVNENDDNSKWVPANVTNPHAEAWCWCGDNYGTYYHSHGAGTFNIKPVPTAGETDEASGFFIGEQSLKTRLDNAVRYSLGTAIAASATLEDRTINRVVAAADNTDDIVLSFPAAVTGKARDFLALVTNTTGNTGSISFATPTGSTIYGDGLSTAIAEGETWLITITEVAANMFFTKAAKMEVAE